jgi:hypothetical protein
MARTMNPYGVGESGDDLIMASSRCECCGILFDHETSRSHPQKWKRCGDCKQHRMDGSPEEQNLALRDHEAVLTEWLEKLSQEHYALKNERDDLNRKLREKAGAIASALQQRDQHLAVLRAVTREHYEPTGASGACTCGQKYPCPTVRAMKNADAGITDSLRRDSWRS